MRNFNKPISCEWNITNYCNLNCYFCSMESNQTNDFDLLNSEKINFVAERIKESGCLYVSLSGGEPMAHPNFFEIVEALRQRGLEVTITTNGTLITEDSIRIMEKLGVKWIQCSLHSVDEQSCLSIMGQSVHQKIIDGILKVKSSSIGVSVCTVINERNAKYAGDIQAWCDEFYIPHYKKELLHVGRFAKLERDDWAQNKETKIKSEKKCATFFAIMPNGDVQICGEFAKSVANIYKHDILKEWQENPLFKMCDTYQHCLAEAYDSNLEIKKQVDSVLKK